MQKIALIVSKGINRACPVQKGYGSPCIECSSATFDAGAGVSRSAHSPTSAGRWSSMLGRRRSQQSGEEVVRQAHGDTREGRR